MAVSPSSATAAIPARAGGCTASITTSTTRRCRTAPPTGSASPRPPCRRDDPATPPGLGVCEVSVLVVRQACADVEIDAPRHVPEMQRLRLGHVQHLALARLARDENE